MKTGRLRLRLILATLCLAYGVLGSGCCGSAKPLLSELNWSTPTRAVETYRKAFAADNGEYEFLTLSQALKDKYDLSSTAYTLGRRRFLDANRGLVKLMLESEVTAVLAVPNTDPAQVAVRVEKGSHFAEFILINEPVAWIKFTDDGDDITLDLPLRDLPSVLLVDGRRLAIDGLPEAPTDLPDKKAINEVRVTKRWRLLEISYLSESLQEALQNEQASAASREGTERRH